MMRFPWLVALGALSAGLANAQTWADLTDDVDLFAVAHLDAIQPKSIHDNVEYCGLFGYDAAGQLAATKAQRGDEDSCDPGIAPAGFEVIASYHTHGAYSADADSEVPSVDDLLGDFEESIDGYISTPSGRVWLNLADDRVSIQLCGPGCIRADAHFRPCPAFPPKEDYTVNALRRRQAADTGDC